MSIEYIREYHNEIRNLREVSGSENESVLRSAFQNCLQKYCDRHNLTLVPELPCSRNAIPDGTIKDSMRLVWGYWEAKDTKDDLDDEITKKKQKGYPNTNIIYEDSETAVLIQSGHEKLRVPMSDVEALDRLITNFFECEPEEVKNFRRASKQFKTDLPNVLSALRNSIDESHTKKIEFREAAENFLGLCQKAINPAVEAADVREMLIQHVLTKDIFLKIFGEEQFHKENNIACRLDELEETFFSGGTKRTMVDHLKGYYSAITVAAASIESHQEKQKFLKAIYEDFYKIYNPKAADSLGVVYTPNEIVSFMIKATNELVHRHFGRRLYDKNVQILDPAAGTGTFITDLIEFIPEAHIAYKYENEIHANEVSILPYYIANLNIEYTYKQKTGKYKEFQNICFVDTLDNLAFKGKGQEDWIGSMSHENLERVKRQNEKRISVIIGNPPYNANQKNENENNKNREYPGIDARIKATYIKQSTAQKTKQYDMYKRFIRWASDRLDKNGVLAFITNRAYLDSRQDDGFRKIVTEEFNEIYIIDLSSDVRNNPKISGTKHNVFGIQTGISIGIFVRRENLNKACEIFYTKREDEETATEKLSFLATNPFSKINFEHIIPDDKNNWLNQIDNDFNELLCVANKNTKLTKSEVKENAIFKLYSLGVVTNRDLWVYDFRKRELSKKVKFLLENYEEIRSKHGGEEVDPDILGQEIKWTRDLKKQLHRNEKNQYDSKYIRTSLYRPFVSKHIYFQQKLNEMQYQMPRIFPSGKKNENKLICFSISKRILFVSLASSNIPSLGLFVEPAQCLPLYHYDEEGNPYSNITNWGLKQFHDHYNNKKITAEDIFHYTYAVLHNPAYLEKYTINLQQEFPRLPFYDDFPKWAQWGKELMDLHINYEKQTPWDLKRTDKKSEPEKPKLKADKEKGMIVLDGKTTLTGIPSLAWDYRLGSRSALEWILDQYKEKKPQDPTILKKFNTYRFTDHKEQVIILLEKICTVSVETMKIVNRMEKQQSVKNN